MTPGLYDSIPESTYHADLTSLSASGAKVLLGKRPPAPDSEALAFGRLVHVILLEPHRLDEYVDLDPDVIGLTVKGERSDNPKNTKAWKEEVLKAQQSGLTIIDSRTLSKAQAMAMAVRDHPEAGRLLAQATDYEVSGYATHPSGAPVRARYDLFGIPRAVVDLKTAPDADPENFGRIVNKYLYHVQAANYVDVARANGIAVDEFLLIAVEKEPTPGGDYRVAVLELHQDAIEKGRELMAEACSRWLALGKRIDLPGYGDERHVVDLPGWAYDDFDDIEIEETA